MGGKGGGSLLLLFADMSKENTSYASLTSLLITATETNTTVLWLSFLFSFLFLFCLFVVFVGFWFVRFIVVVLLFWGGGREGRGGGERGLR